MINALFECDIYRFICTRTSLAEKMMSETFFFTMKLPGFICSHVFYCFTCFICFSSGLQYVELGKQWSLENCLEISPFHQKRLGLLSVLRAKSSYWSQGGIQSATVCDEPAPFFKAGTFKCQANLCNSWIWHRTSEIRASHHLFTSAFMKVAYPRL